MPDPVDLAEPIDVAIDDRDLRLHAGGDLRGVRSGHAGAEHHDLGGSHAGRASHQDAPAAVGTLQDRRTLLRSHAPGDLRHRRQQRKTAVGGLHGLIGDALHLPLCEERRQPRVRGQMQVGEQHLPLPEPFVLLGLRLLDLHDHVGLGEDLVGTGRDARARLDESRIVDRRAHARGSLDEHVVSGGGQLTDTFGRGGHPVLVVLDFLRDPDLHAAAPVRRA